MPPNNRKSNEKDMETDSSGIAANMKQKNVFFTEMAPKNGYSSEKVMETDSSEMPPNNLKSNEEDMETDSSGIAANMKQTNDFLTETAPKNGYSSEKVMETDNSEMPPIPKEKVMETDSSGIANVKQINININANVKHIDRVDYNSVGDISKVIESSENPTSSNVTSLSNAQTEQLCDLSKLNLRKETDRLLSFRNWRIEFLDTALLAKIGFYYLGRTDKVKCFFCNLAIDKWEPNDDPLTEHLKYSATCPLLRRRNTSNIPIDEENLNTLLPKTYYDTCGTGAIRSDSVLMKHPDYQYVPTRFRSFDSWPPGLTQRPEELADAGFYYTGSGDQVICFSCGTGLKDWEKNDIPMEEHARHSRGCAYLNFMMGDKYSQQIKDKYNRFDSGPPIIEPVAPVNQSDSMDDKSCKICYENPAELAFVPCGHVATCKSCGFSMTKCPVCRENIKDKVKVFF